jgi:hypothetical protein
MPATRKHPKKKRSKNWVKTVTTSAIDVPEGTMNKPASRSQMSCSGKTGSKRRNRSIATFSST